MALKITMVVTAKAKANGSSPAVRNQVGSVEQPAATAKANDSSPSAPNQPDSVGQPATFLPLKELTDRSARIGQFKLGIFQPWEDKYKYTYNGEERTATAFKCLLVDLDDPTWYCHAEYKKSAKNASSYQAGMNKFKEGAVFIMKQIGFVRQTKSSYLSAPKRDVVDLACTTTQAVHGLGKASAVQPCPPGTVVEKLHLKEDQRFDLTALIKTMSAIREAGPERRCFDVELIDGSTNEAKNKKQIMKVTLFQPKESHIEDECRDCMNRLLPVTFLHLQGSKSAKGEFTFQSAFKGWHMMKASTEQSGDNKAKQLVLDAEALMSEQNTESFAGKTFEHTDYSLVMARETTVALLLSLPKYTSGIADLDEEESVWQINWVHVNEPAAKQSIYNKTGERIWFPVTFRDATMQHTLWMQEKAALQLANCTTAAEFSKKYADGKLWFPLICSLKIARKRNVAKIEDPDEAARSATDDFDAIIVQAGEQDLKQTPTSSSLVLLHMMASRMDTADVFMPASLHMLQKSDVYSMCVHFEPQQLPGDLSQDLQPLPSCDLLRACNQAFCLVQATAGGETQRIGDEGFKLITKGVKDALPSSAAQSAPDDYTLTAFCTMGDLQDFKLDPPRGSKSQHALIMVSDIVPGTSADEPPNVIVDSLMLIHRDDVAMIKKAMQKMLYYAAAATEMNARKRKEEWSESFSPAKAKKCRSMARHPTGEVLPEYTPEKRKQDVTPRQDE